MATVGRIDNVLLGFGCPDDRCAVSGLIVQGAPMTVFGPRDLGGVLSTPVWVAGWIHGEPENEYWAASFLAPVEAAAFAARWNNEGDPAQKALQAYLHGRLSVPCASNEAALAQARRCRAGVLSPDQDGPE